MQYSLPPRRLPRDGEEPLRFGLVGAGTHGRGAVMPAFSQSPACQLVAVADAGIDLVNFEEIRNQGIATYRSLEEMLEKEQLDAVYIATLPSTHCSIALTSFEAGLHVVCEKPMATTAEEAQEMNLAAETAGLLLLVMFENRFKQHYLTLREWITSGAIGQVEAIHLQTFGRHPSAQPRRKNLLDAAGCLDCGIHQLDLVRFWLNGGEWHDIHARGAWFGEDVINPPHIAMTARVDGRVLVSFEDSFSYGAGLRSAPWNFARDSLTIVGSEGVIADGLLGGTLTYELLSDERRESVPVLRSSHSEEIACVLNEFAFAVRYPLQAPHVSLAWGEDGLAAQIVTDEVNRQCRETRSDANGALRPETFVASLPRV